MNIMFGDVEINRNDLPKEVVGLIEKSYRKKLIMKNLELVRENIILKKKIAEIKEKIINKFSDVRHTVLVSHLLSCM